jgi:hypothetical protein
MDSNNNGIKPNTKATFSFIEGNIPWIILSCVLILLSVYVRIRLLNIPLERDEGEFTYLAQQMLKGIPPFASAYSLKIPGIFGVYALGMKFFGQSLYGIHSILLLANIATIFLIFLLCKMICDVRFGLIASSVYAILSVSYPLLGVIGHATHFVVLFAMAGFVCLFVAFKKRSASYLLISGFMFGISFTMKQHAAAFSIFAFLCLVREGFKLKLGWRKMIYFMALFVAGGILPYIGWVLYLAANGVFQQFWFWTVKYASEYATDTTIAEGWLNFKAQFGKILGTSGIFWLLAFIQWLLLATGIIKKQNRFFLTGLFIASFIAILPGFYFRNHYFIMMLPAVSILIGSAVSTFLEAMQQSNANSRKIYGLFAMIFVAAICTIMIVKERQYLFYDSPEKVSKSIYNMKPFVESKAIAKYIKENTSADDYIAVLGSEPQIYFYADRPSASGYICVYGLMEAQPFAIQMQNQFAHEIEAKNPKFIVNVTDPSSWLPRQNSPQNIFYWAESYLSSNYELVGLIAISDTFSTKAFWGPEARQWINTTPSELQIYRRKT